MFRFVIELVVIGIMLYIMNRYAPVVDWMKTLINWFVGILVVIWMLELFGLWPRGFPVIHLP